MHCPVKNTLTLNRPRSHRRTGATVVEFAVIAPVLFSLIFGLIEFSRLVMVQQALTNAAREGCRMASLATTTSGDAVEAEVRNSLRGTVASPLDSSIVRVTVSPSSFDGLASCARITTSVAVTYSDVSWFPPWFVGDIEMHGTAVMERE